MNYIKKTFSSLVLSLYQGFTLCYLGLIPPGDNLALTIAQIRWDILIFVIIKELNWQVRYRSNNVNRKDD